MPVLIFLYIFVCRVSWKCCAFLFISFLHSSLSVTKSLSVWPVLTYFSQRSTHFRSCFRDCLKNLRGLPGFFLPDLIHHALSFGNSIIWHPFHMASISQPGQSTIRFHSSDGSSFVYCVCPIKVFIHIFNLFIWAKCVTSSKLFDTIEKTF